MLFKKTSVQIGFGWREKNEKPSGEFYRPARTDVVKLSISTWTDF